MVGYNEYQNITPLPRRRAYFIFGDDDEEQDKFLLEGLNVKFDVLYNTGGMFPQANFSICNLNADHLQYLTSLFWYNNRERRNRTIKFFAGYDDAKNPKKLKDIPLLYKGVVMLTTTTPPPDITLNIQAMACGNIHSARVAVSFKGEKTIREIAAAATEFYGLELEWRAGNSGSKKIKNFTCDGTGYDYAHKLYEADSSLCFSADSLRLRVTDMRPEAAYAALPRWKVDRNHAMIGIPRFAYWGATVDTLLNPLIRAGDFVELKSKYQPAGDGEYFILTVRHHGELRGNDFTTTLDLMRPANFDDKYEPEPEEVRAADLQ